jgi:predicted MFS family arabinose efflux permease
MSLPSASEPSAPDTRLYAVGVGVIVLGLYASQALISDLGRSLGLGAWANAVTALTMAGYSAGLLLLVPLVDVTNHRRLIAATLVLQVAALAAAALAHAPAMFLVASFAIGVTSTAIQMLVPVVASLAPEAQRGRVVGDVMSGLMLGILLSRPLASLVAGTAGWRSYYGLEAVAAACVTLLVVRGMPRTNAVTATSYPRLIRSLLTLLRQEPVLRKRALYQSLLMAAFSTFWTSVALVLERQPFGLGHVGVALFALAGASGAVISPIAGRLGDRGLGRAATTCFHLVAAGAALLALLAGQGLLPRALSLALLVLAAVLLDLGVIGDQALGRRAINLLNPQARGRLNGLFTGLFFVGGAVGALVTGPAWARWGWQGVCATTFGFALLAFLAHGLEPKPRARPSAEPACGANSRAC